MNIKSLVSNLGGSIVRFKNVMKKRWPSVTVGILLTWAALIIRISLAEKLVYTSDDIYILGCEMITESGPKFREALECHKDILKQHKKYMEQRLSKNIPQSVVASASRCPGFSWLFAEWDEYRAEKGVDKAMEILSSVEKEASWQNILEATWKAGEELLEFREKMISFRRVGRIEIGFYKSTRVPKKLSDKTLEAIENSAQKRDAFRAQKSWENAWALCEANRKSTLLLFLARSRYKDKETDNNIEHFRKIVEDSSKDKKDYSKKFAEDSPVGKLLALFADSDERRLGILEAMQHNDMGKARYLMWQAKEEAKQNKTVVLDIAENPEFAADDAKAGI